MNRSTDFPAVAAAEGSVPLEPLIERISQQHFEGQAKHTIRWGIPPSVSVTRVVTRNACLLTPDEQTRLAQAQSLLESHAFAQAATVLMPLADAGDPTAEHLLIHTLKRLHDDRWETYAARHAKRHQTVQLVPASSYEVNENHITLHYYLARRNAPRYVLAYLIFHECARAKFRFLGGSPCAGFLASERDAPYRNKAQQWLRRHGFPIFLLDEGDPSPSLSPSKSKTGKPAGKRS